MGWDNPPIPWRELQRRMEWGAEPSAPSAPSAPGFVRHESPPDAIRVARSSKGRPLPWAELHVHSCYSFLDGAASPEELVAEANRLGLTALAITDHDGMYGVPQFAQAAARSAVQTA